MKTYLQIVVLLTLTLWKTTFSIEIPNLSSETLEGNYEAFKNFGDKNLEQKPIALSLALNANLENTFEHNLILPNPDDYQNLLTTQTYEGVRYTSTPVKAYKVTEEVYEPQPVPQIVKPATAPLVLGSGSLGVVDLGQGKYALGSGSLGYSQPVLPQPGVQVQVKKADLSDFRSSAGLGGLHVVDAPKLGSSEAFDAAFNNFNFKPLNHYFENN